MLFYDFRAAPSPRKVRLFIAEKGIDVPSVQVDLRAQQQHSPGFLARNSGGTVPVLELDDGTCLTESLAICHYLESRFPEPNLMGRDGHEQARVLMWNDILTLEGYLAFQEALRNGHEAFKGRALPGPVPWEQIPQLAERGRRRAAIFLDKLDTRLGESEYVAGERVTYADIVAFVYVGFAPRAVGFSPTDGRPALAQWHERIAARPAIAAAG
jgi:glutathione S-transferase